MRKGKFITIEGGEGVGKTTQSFLLMRALRDKGIPVYLTKEPGGCESAKAIRQLILNSSLDFSPISEILLFTAARREHIDRVIKPALDSGIWVISDRYIDSTVAYQTTETLTEEYVLHLHELCNDGLMPDRTYILSLPGVEGLTRARSREETNNFDFRSEEYHRLVNQKFLSILNRNERCCSIDATGSEEDVLKAILEDVLKLAD